MTFYHGSTNPNLTLLKKEHSRDGYVYATTNKLVALTYAARSFPNLFSTKNNKICFFELKSNLFEKMTKFKKGYIYTLKDEGFSPVDLQKQKCTHKSCYCTKNDVEILAKEEIKDIYKELLQYEKQGEFILYKYDDIPNKTKNKMINDIKNIAKTLPHNAIDDKNTFWKFFLE